jgi:hypothetical protein
MKSPADRQPWPGHDGHSAGGRPQVYRGRSGWWVDASAFLEDQQLFATWPEAIEFALHVPFQDNAWVESFS